MKKLSSCFAVVVLVLCFVAASSSVAQAQRAATGFQFATNVQSALYGATAKSDVCLAVFLLDATGRINYVRYGYLATLYTTTISTGKYVPVFVAYTPANIGPTDYLVTRCAAQPAAGTIITDPALEPKLWLSLAPNGPNTRVDVDQANVGAIGIMANVALLAGIQSNSFTQVNYSNVTTTTGFGGVSEVTFEPNPAVNTLLARLSSCGTPYMIGLGYGATCNPAAQP